MTNFYLTTTLPYVNAEPHIGFALEIVQADTLARYHKLEGDRVFFNFGTDEHGLKIYLKAKQNKQTPQEYCDIYAAKFDLLKKALNLSYNNFIRTTDPHHIKAAQHFWTLCKKNNDIYKQVYPLKYCIGCEMEKQDSDLIDGKCPYHPNKKLKIIKEENYFFRWSKYQNKLLKLYQTHPNFVLPKGKQKEITKFVASGIKDFSISRLKSKMPWGIPVPDDDKHVMYVWFDALINYISALNWPENPTKFKQFWGSPKTPNAIQLAGPDNLRQQSAMWQAMLLSAGLPTSKQILIHGFLTLDGQKISKSIGNVIDPIAETQKYGTDAVRYYLLAEFAPFQEGDYSRIKFETRYNADLANGLGNLVARVSKLAEKSNLRAPNFKNQKFSPLVKKFLNKYQYNHALKFIWEQQIRTTDQYLNEQKPWKQSNKDQSVTLTKAITNLQQIGYNLQPFLPETAKKILIQFKQNSKITSQPALFPRLEKTKPNSSIKRN